MLRGVLSGVLVVGAELSSVLRALLAVGSKRPSVMRCHGKHGRSHTFSCKMSIDVSRVDAKSHIIGLPPFLGLTHPSQHSHNCQASQPSATFGKSQENLVCARGTQHLLLMVIHFRVPCTLYEYTAVPGSSNCSHTTTNQFAYRIAREFRWHSLVGFGYSTGTTGTHSPAVIFG